MIFDEVQQFRRRSLAIALIAVVVVFILWNVSQLALLLYPFRLFVTFVHESGHGLAAIVTGGRFERFVVNSNGSGVALTAGGNRLLILPAGYLGAALFGAALFFVVNTLPYSRQISFVLGVGLALLTVLFASIDSAALLVGLLSAALLIAISYRGGRDLNLLLLNLVAIMTGLNAALDLLFLVGSSNTGLGNLRNDAAAFSGELGGIVPAPVWALLWAAIAVAMLAVSVYWSLIRPRRIVR